MNALLTHQKYGKREEINEWSNINDVYIQVQIFPFKMYFKISSTQDKKLPKFNIQLNPLNRNAYL